jgi:L-lactate dehydrogenase
MIRQSTNDKIVIIGSGTVGSTLAYVCLLRGVTRNIVLVDRNRDRVDSEVLDLNHGLQFVSPAQVQGTDDIAGACAGARVVVITAGARKHPGQTRMDLAAQNTEICRTLVPQIASGASENTILLLVTNPVDVMTYVTLKLSGMTKNRVLGSGTVLDSSRFRFLIGQRLNVSVLSVHAYIAGEHGDSEIPLWSSARIGSIPLHEWAIPQHGRLSVVDRTQIFQDVKNAGSQIVAGKGATNYAIGLATVRILQALLDDENSVLPVSSLMENYRGINDVCLSVPCIVNGSGVEQALPIPLNENEEAGLRNSADRIRQVIRQVGF